MFGIHVRYFYTNGTYTYGRDTGPLLRGHVYEEVLDRTRRLKFKTKKAAEKFLIEDMSNWFRYTCEHSPIARGYRPKDVYYLRSGEYDRPTYKIVKLRA